MRSRVDAMDVLDEIGSVAYPVLQAPITAASRSYFRKITIRNPERIPPSGPLLVIANHPATLSEVFLLGTRLGRRFHFLAASFVFQPWIRGALARFCGALPIYRRQDNPELTYRNEDVFRACHALFDRGGAVVIFPEGESKTDRAVLPLKTGAARLALGYDCQPGREGNLVVVPVGVYFSDRTRFQSEVVLSVGQKIDLKPFSQTKGGDPQEVVRNLTAVMQQSLEGLILNVPNDVIARFVHDVERLYIEDLKEERPGEPNLQLLRRMADCIHHYQSVDPERVYSGWRRTAAYWRKLDALGVMDPVLQKANARISVGRAVLVAIGIVGGFPFAVIGFLVNVLPFYVSVGVAKAVAPDPIRVSAGRMIAGTVFFPLAYALAAAGLRRFTGWSWPLILGTLVCCAALGFFALLYIAWVRGQSQHLRLVFLASRHGRLVAKLRAERKDLIQLFDEAREEYLAAAEETPQATNLVHQQERS